MSTALAEALAEARLHATLGFLDSGDGHARIRIYAEPRPSSPADAPAGAALLLEVTLAKPAGSVASAVLTLTPVQGATVAASGTAAWARVINGDDASAWDCDVSDLAGTALVRLSSLALVGGTAAPLVAGVIG